MQKEATAKTAMNSSFAQSIFMLFHLRFFVFGFLIHLGSFKKLEFLLKILAVDANFFFLQI